ncbi:MAG: hypothetical protein ACE5PT_01280 [Gemmatimonadales bacterium]
MRQSTAILADTGVRLADLNFPANRVHIHRTRLAFIHLDNVLHFAKIDRDGRVDGYVTAYLPDEVAVLLMRRGEVITAVAFTESGREVIPIATALRRMQQETERGELVYADAPAQQLAWMYQSCAAPARSRFVDPNHPEQLFPALKHEEFTGVLEIISRGCVNYLRFENGDYVNSHLWGNIADTSVSRQVQGLFAPDSDGTLPQLAATVFPATDELPAQASPALIETYRELFWQLVNTAEKEMPGESLKRAIRLRDEVAQEHHSLKAIGTPADRPVPDLVATPEEITAALAAWTHKILEQLEVIAPGVAPEVLKGATREHRFVLQRAGFYEALPWTVSW